MNRIEWIDISKGIGILCMVTGHALACYKESTLYNIIYMFHMPLFFYISGYLYKKENNTWEYIKDKSIRFLIPYFFVLILFTPINGLSELMHKSPLALGYILSFIWKIFSGGRNLGGATGAFWFVTCLYLTQILYNFLQRKFNDKIITILAVTMLGLGYINAYVFPEAVIFWNTNTVLIALPLYHFGYLYKNTKFEFSSLLIFALAVISVLLTIFIPANTLDMKVANYGIPIVTLACSFIMFAAIKKASELVSEQKLLSTLFTQLGKASLVIMYFHYFILVILHSKLHFTNVLICTIVATSIPYLIYYIANKYPLTRILFIGSKKDYYKIIEKN